MHQHSVLYASSRVNEIIIQEMGIACRLLISLEGSKQLSNLYDLVESPEAIWNYPIMLSIKFYTS